MGRDVGGSEVRRRTGRWKARVLSVTSRRKNRYCSISGWACRIAAFVGAGEVALGGLW